MKDIYDRVRRNGISAGVNFWIRRSQQLNPTISKDKLLESVAEYLVIGRLSEHLLPDSSDETKKQFLKECLSSLQIKISKKNFDCRNDVSEADYDILRKLVEDSSKWSAYRVRNTPRKSGQSTAGDFYKRRSQQLNTTISKGELLKLAAEYFVEKKLRWNLRPSSRNKGKKKFLKGFLFSLQRKLKKEKFHCCDEVSEADYKELHTLFRDCYAKKNQAYSGEKRETVCPQSETQHQHTIERLADNVNTTPLEQLQPPSNSMQQVNQHLVAHPSKYAQAAVQYQLVENEKHAFLQAGGQERYPQPGDKRRKNLPDNGVIKNAFSSAEVSTEEGPPSTEVCDLPLLKANKNIASDVSTSTHQPARDQRNQAQTTSQPFARNYIEAHGSNPDGPPAAKRLCLPSQRSLAQNSSTLFQRKAPIHRNIIHPEHQQMDPLSAVLNPPGIDLDNALFGNFATNSETDLPLDYPIERFDLPPYPLQLLDDASALYPVPLVVEDTNQHTCNSEVERNDDLLDNSMGPTVADVSTDQHGYQSLPQGYGLFSAHSPRMEDNKQDNVEEPSQEWARKQV